MDYTMTSIHLKGREDALRMVHTIENDPDTSALSCSVIYIKNKSAIEIVNSFFPKVFIIIIVIHMGKG